MQSPSTHESNESGLLTVHRVKPLPGDVLGLLLQWVVVMVSAGLLVRVDPWWGDEFGSVVGSEPDFPFGRMCLLVVIQA